MDRDRASECACPAASCKARHKLSPSPRPECAPIFPLRRAEALFLILLLSLALWGLIWAALSALAI